MVQPTGQPSQYVSTSLSFVESALAVRLPIIAKSNELLVSSALITKYQHRRSQECLWVKANFASRAASDFW